MKKALIFDCYDDYNIRIQYIQKALENAGYVVSIYFADYDHYKKQYYAHKRTGIHYLHVKEYRKNLSWQRLYSHYDFAKKCRMTAEQSDADLIYVMVPPNSMVQQFAKYRKKHPQVLLWFDVLDMWPESLPVSNKLKKVLALPLQIWKNFRNPYLHAGDLISVECNKFYDVIARYADSEKMKTVYLCQPEHQVEQKKEINESIHFLYCGSMNHLMDIELICAFAKSMKQHKEIVIELIGDGENRQLLIDRLKKENISYQYHGFVYEEEEKKKIYAGCHFGLNLMKDTVFVGLTMKSLDYLSHSLPIINNIPSDTYEIVEKEKIGYNISSENLELITKQISEMSTSTYQKMQEQTNHIFVRLFSEENVVKQLGDCIKELENRGKLQ